MLPKSKYTRLIVLIDPDKFNPELVTMARPGKVSYFFVGGSRITSGHFEKTIRTIKSKTKVPVIIFPGDTSQVSGYADGLLLLSLISGRNPDYLIGLHVEAARTLKRSKLPVYPTGYILVGGGQVSTTQQVTKTLPLAAGDATHITDTALAGELLGMKLIYLEAGSGAQEPVPLSLIRSVKKNLSIPLIVGGGIDTISKAKQVIKSGADYMVVGNALERDPDFLLALNDLF